MGLCLYKGSKYLKYLKIYLSSSHFQNLSTGYGSLCQRLAGFSLPRAAKRAVTLHWHCLELAFPHIIMLCYWDLLWAENRIITVTLCCVRLGGGEVTWLHCFHFQSRFREQPCCQTHCTAGSAVYEGLHRQDIQIPNLLMKQGFAGVTWVPSIHLQCFILLCSMKWMDSS